MKAALKVPFRMEGIFRVDDQPVHKALREALANCLTNANWFERKGVVCLWEEDRLTIANPGDFRMEVEIAKQPGESDPRNETLLRMFSLVEIGERAGSGMGIIYEGWADAGLVEPMYEERFGPDRTVLTLPLVSADEAGNNRQKADKSGQERKKANESERKGRNDLSLQEKQVIDAMRASAAPMKASDIAACMGLGKTRTSELLKSLIESGTVVVEGASRSRRYRLANG